MTYYIIGERELVVGFSLVGVDGCVANSREQALDAFRQITAPRAHLQTSRPKVLIITELVADYLQEEIQEWQMKGTYPLIVEIPPLQGHIEGRKSLTEAIREAIGIKV
ncbi:ATPase V [Treponema phagedenis]|uniref:ATP synthase, subunit F n=1 Tax=Treponema phagedenis TaxID=162 RepID=A0A0B7GTD7_TREPH|nr:V-type ATP synthase subunit F [Treponema phagedenis]EFW38523.1 ATP synthase, subunit F [Treponema phagedenis F0421]NVP24576.1 ATPase V [Treponema phagedenis]QEJ94727.1 ATPase V [Treponema phagedenis]QEJ97663.1 ATPase V [Treponema phagedenis]QEK00632.1 ATPase V [Treponema phagedenis]